MYTTNTILCKFLTIFFFASMFSEETTNPALAVTEQWHSILYAVAGILLALLVTTFTVLLFRRCKHHESETNLCRRSTVVREQHLHVHDVVQPNLDTTALHNLRGVSASAVENQPVPSPLDMEETEDRLYENVSHYENVGDVSASAVDNQPVPSPLDMEETEDRLYENINTSTSIP